MSNDPRALCVFMHSMGECTWDIMLPLAEARADWHIQMNKLTLLNRSYMQDRLGFINTTIMI